MMRVQTIHGRKGYTPILKVAHKHLLSVGILLSSFIASFMLSGCSNSVQESAAEAVISSPASAVKHCQFLEEIDTIARATIGNARYELKSKAAALGATHVVELYAYAEPFNSFSWDLGVALTGRAYRCPQGTGPLDDDPDALKSLPYDMPHPEVNRDDPLLLTPLRPSYIGKPHN